YKKWPAHRVNSYRIKISQDGVWINNVFDITVKQGRVTDAWALVQWGHRRYEMDNMEAEGYLVPGLFARARSLLKLLKSDEVASVTYDKDYDFPRQMGTDQPGVVDATQVLEVREFEVLK